MEGPDQGLFLAINMAIAPIAIAITIAPTDTYVIVFIEFCSVSILLLNEFNVLFWLCIVLKLSTIRSERGSNASATEETFSIVRYVH